MKKDKNENEIIMYTTSDGRTKLRVNVSPKENTVWLTQKQMGELFQTTVPNVNMHIKNVLDEGELDDNSVIKDFLITADDGKNYNTLHYNLDMIIAVGYRIKSLRGTQFRKWATNILNEYIRKGFAMNDELLKEAGGGNYFKELLQRIRDIRASEKVFYRQILDIYATSVDYNANAEETLAFFKLVQNKMHFAVHGKTAPELIMERAKAELPFMGLTAFKGNQPMKSEVTIAKNYLSESEIKTLNLITSMYLDFAERQAEKGQLMKMKDWKERLDDFLKMNREQILTNAGTVKHEDAVKYAEQEYDKYKTLPHGELTQIEQDYIKNIRETYNLLEKGAKK